MARRLRGPAPRSPFFTVFLPDGLEVVAQRLALEQFHGVPGHAIDEALGEDADHPGVANTAQGVRLTPADYYVAPDGEARAEPVPNAVRLTLGAVADRARLERALATLAAILAQPTAQRASSP